MSTGDSTLPASIVVEGGRVQLRLNASAYRVDAIQKAGYRLAKRCSVLIEAVEAETLPVTLLIPHGASVEYAHETANLFLRELCDQQLRAQLHDEIRPVRELILAQAFSNTDLIERT